MKLSELLSRLDSEESPYYGDVEFIYECLNEGGYYVDLAANGFTQRPITEWYCTDSCVGTTAIYWNGEFICLTSQKSRNSDVNIQWLNKEIFHKVSAFVQSLVVKENHEPKCLNLEKEYGETYTLEFTVQILSDWAFYDGEKCRILRDKNLEEMRKDCITYRVWIEQNSIVEDVHISELEFPVALKDT
jgi:hypothetical protein